MRALRRPLLAVQLGGPAHRRVVAGHRDALDLHGCCRPRPPLRPTRRPRRRSRRTRPRSRPRRCPASAGWPAAGPSPRGCCTSRPWGSRGPAARRGSRGRPSRRPPRAVPAPGQDRGQRDRGEGRAHRPHRGQRTPRPSDAAAGAALRCRCRAAATGRRPGASWLVTVLRLALDLGGPADGGLVPGHRHRADPGRFGDPVGHLGRAGHRVDLLEAVLAGRGRDPALRRRLSSIAAFVSGGVQLAGGREVAVQQGPVVAAEDVRDRGLRVGTGGPAGAGAGDGGAGAAGARRRRAGGRRATARARPRRRAARRRARSGSVSWRAKIRA